MKIGKFKIVWENWGFNFWYKHDIVSIYLSHWKFKRELMWYDGIHITRSVGWIHVYRNWGSYTEEELHGICFDCKRVMYSYPDCLECEAGEL